MKTQLWKRRDLLKKSGLTGLGVLTAGLAQGQDCVSTPAQAAGPFYPARVRYDEDNDLTHVRGRDGQPLGEAIVLKGQILSTDCEPLPGAIVEIWQACDSGRYDHPLDDNPAPIDPNFQSGGSKKG